MILPTPAVKAGFQQKFDQPDESVTVSCQRGFTRDRQRYLDSFDCDE